MPDLGSTLADQLIDGTGPGIAAALVDTRGGMELGAAGLADIETGRPMTPDTPACIGSVSKSFTAAAVLRLRDEGRLALEDPLVHHLPEVAGFRDPFGAALTVTLRDVLRHLAGLPDEAPSPDPRTWSPRSVSAVFADPACVRWAIPPGTGFKYSNLGYELLGEVIARASGTTYAAFVRDAILEPSGMRATTLEPAADVAARGYDPLDAEGRRHPARRMPDGSAAGGWWSTARDLGRWASAQLAPDAASAAAVREAHRPVVVTDPGLGSAYGLGWRIIRRGDRIRVAHGGLTSGFEARVEVDPQHGTGVAVLVNGVGPRDPARRVALRLLDVGGDRSEPDPAPAPAASSRPGLAGEYREVGFETLVTIELRGTTHWLRSDGDAGGPLIPTDDPDRYRIEHGRSAGEDLVVLRDASGAIDGINVAGYPMIRLRSRGAP